MSKIQIQTEVDLIPYFSKLKVSELEVMVKEINTLIALKKSKSKKKRIEELSQLINKSVLKTNKLNRYKELVEKLENSTIAEEENKEFLILVEEDEMLRNQRVTYMIELSQLRQVPFQEIIDEFSLEKTSHA